MFNFNLLAYISIRVAERVPHIVESKKVIIVTDDEKVITKYETSIGKIMQNSRKRNLFSNYKTDFINLVLQKSERSHNSVLVRLYLKWNKVD